MVAGLAWILFAGVCAAALVGALVLGAIVLAPGHRLSTSMTPPLSPPLPPARAVAHEPATGDGWAYEPKWDGFRAPAFVSTDIHLQSRNGSRLPLLPEIVLPRGAT